MLYVQTMARNLKKRIFWTQHPPEHIDKAKDEPYRGIVVEWDRHPALGEWENELLWILNDDFNPKLKGAAQSLRVQKEVRRWADRWIENPAPVSFSQDITQALRGFYFAVEFSARDTSKDPPNAFPPPLKYDTRPAISRKDPTLIWLFALAYTLSKWGPKGFGKCGICGNYFIDIMHRGKNHCSLQCTGVARTRRLITKKTTRTRKT